MLTMAVFIIETQVKYSDELALGVFGSLLVVLLKGVWKSVFRGLGFEV